MKKSVLIIMFSLFLLAGLSCGKGSGDKSALNPGDGPVKYAKFGASVYKEQDLKTWSSNISKTEPVSLVETLKVQIKGAETEIAKIKLSDGNIAYIQMKHLADKPVVFVEDTKAYVRNNASSKVYAVIPKGSIGFVVQEMGEWTQVYVGQVEGKWITQQWVNGGYSSEDARIQEAKNFEEAAAVLKDSKAKPDQKAQATAVLKDIADSYGIFSDAARSLIAADSGDDVSDHSEGSEADGELGSAQVNAASGLTVREQPGTSSKSVVIIPNGSTVKILKKGDVEETIAGKTASWYEIEWNGTKGWVFGGFLMF